MVLAPVFITIHLLTHFSFLSRSFRKCTSDLWHVITTLATVNFFQGSLQINSVANTFHEFSLTLFPLCHHCFCYPNPELYGIPPISLTKSHLQTSVTLQVAFPMPWMPSVLYLSGQCPSRLCCHISPTSDNFPWNFSWSLSPVSWKLTLLYSAHLYYAFHLLCLPIKL